MNWKSNIAFILVILFWSCKPSTQDSLKYDWLIGAWKKEGTANTERWNKINDLSYQGMGYENVNNEVSVSEYLRLYKLDGHWNLSAIVKDQNAGKETIFKSTGACTQTILEVALPSHDFPKKIKYQLLSDSLIEITLNGNLENELKYKLKKVPYFEIEG